MSSSVFDYRDDLLEFLQQSNFIEGASANIDCAIASWNHLIVEDVLTSRLIREAHQILMENQKLAKKHRGVFRQEPVFIGEFKKENLATHWANIPSSLDTIIRAINSTIKVKSVLEDSQKTHLAMQYHVAFEHIHPFLDGNGRIGRIIMNWHLQKLDMPIMIIKEKNKEQYYNWFKQHVKNI
jgi:Fic family protein